MKITLVNPSQTLSKLLKKWETGQGYTLTCRSRTCSCFSHDSGYDWREYEFPANIWGYVEKKIGRNPGSPSSHKSCYWVFPKLERELRENRDERAAEFAKWVIETQAEAIANAKYLGDYGVIPRIRELCSEALEGNTSDPLVDGPFFGLRQDAKTKRQAEWDKKFAARDGVSFPKTGNGWKFIPA